MFCILKSFGKIHKNSPMPQPQSLLRSATLLKGGSGKGFCETFRNSVFDGTSEHLMELLKLALLTRQLIILTLITFRSYHLGSRTITSEENCPPIACSWVLIV